MSAVGTRPGPTVSGAGRTRGTVRAHPVRAELLRGLAPWAGAIVGCALGLAMALRASWWQGSWSETQSALRYASVLFGAPLAGAAGCWQGAREHRRRTVELLASTPRGPLARLLAAALPGALWSAAVYLLVAGAALLACLPYAGPGRPEFTAALTDAVFLVAVTVIGHVCGSLVPRRLTPPGYAVVLLIVFSFTSTASSGVRHLTPMDAENVMSGSVAVWWQPLASAVWFTGLTGAVVLAHAARRRYTALAPLAAAGVAAVLIVQTGDRMWREDPLSRREVCDTRTVPEVCVAASDSPLLPRVTAALSPLTDKLADVEGAPRLIGLRRDTRPGEAPLPELRPGLSVVRGELIDATDYMSVTATNLTTAPAACGRPTPGGASEASGAVELWLLPSSVRAEWLARQRGWSAGETAELARLERRADAAERLAGLPAERRRAWLTGFFAALTDCAPGKTPPL
ncbi:hypothetical protein ACIP88_28950 [Streptomyces uncialis]|uniref:hypothetical protein n=1 Tax=Streptomyces uncialis TaxID=1048205 RepID=UPI00381C8712